MLRKFKISDDIDYFNKFLADENSYRSVVGKPIKNIIGAYFVCFGYKCKSKYRWAIEHNGEVIGCISTYYINQINNECNLGYTIGSKFWNKGFATETIKAVIKFLFDEIGLNKFRDNCYNENIGSFKVMKKTGITKEGIFRDHYDKNDKYYNGYLYSIIKKDYLQLN